ncbi:MAG: glycosyltransferase [archaeon]
MISIVITSFREPKTVGRAIDSFLNQNIEEDYELVVAAPDNETQKVVIAYSKTNKKIKLFKDPGKGKSYALNLLLSKLKGEIVILTDGDVYVSKNSVNEISKMFRDKKVGCVSGCVISEDSRENMFGYWSHLLCDAAHRLRKNRDKKNEFLECSGYLWAFRNNVIGGFPLDVGEDTIVPIIFWTKGYGIRYVSHAKVFVKYPKNTKDFVKQKIRTAAAHDNIGKYYDLKKIPRMKTFKNEVLGGFRIFFYPRNIKEVLWTFWLLPFRLYIWANLFYNSRFIGKKYSDAWKPIESSKN